MSTERRGSRNPPWKMIENPPIQDEEREIHRHTMRKSLFVSKIGSVLTELYICYRRLIPISKWERSNAIIDTLSTQCLSTFLNSFGITEQWWLSISTTSIRLFCLTKNLHWRLCSESLMIITI